MFTGSGKNIYFAVFVLFMTTALCAADEPRIIILKTPERPVAGSTWTFTLLVAHNEPNEVEVMAPPFTGSLFLDQVIKGPRFFNQATGQSYINQPVSADDGTVQPVYERWTIMEYRFLLSGPGTVSFDAFTVITPEGQTRTAPFDLTILRPRGTAEVQNFRLVWEGQPSELGAGESAEFCLRVSNWNFAESSLPSVTMFLPEVPPGHILETISLSDEEKLSGMALKLHLIPLEEKPFVLERRQFSHNNVIFEVPALRIPVNLAAASTANNKNTFENTGSPLPFPSADIGINVKYQAECESIYAAAKNLWESNEKAAALAMLRRNERDHPARAFFRSVRREAEAGIGLSGTNDEKKKLLPFFREKFRSAVIRECIVRQVPDSAGREIALLREGQPVLLDGKSYPSAMNQSWQRVMSNDDSGISGWILAEFIIIY